MITVKPGRMKQDDLHILKKMGLNCFRINLARNSLNENIQQLEWLKQSGKKVFVDLPGEKWRINYQRDIRILKLGDIIYLKYGETVEKDPSVATINEKKLFESISVGDKVTLGDSNLKCDVIKVEKEIISLQCIKTGKLYNKAGIVIANKYNVKESLCENDRVILSKLPYGSIDYLCVSFTDCPEIIKETQTFIPHSSSIKVIAKIESPIGIKNIREILEISDGILLARSDLSKFYNRDELASLAVLFREITSGNKEVIFASNYFINSVRNNSYDENESSYFLRDYSLNPDYMFINETYYSSDYLKVIGLYQRSL